MIIIVGLSCTNSGTQRNHSNSADTLLSSALPVLISDSSNTLEKDIQTLKLEYTGWGCACANWITSSDARKYKDSAFAQHHIFIEPADSTIYDPEQDSTFNILKEKIIVIGQFYMKKDYPHPTYKMEEDLEKARVFRYTKIKRINENINRP